MRRFQRYKWGRTLKYHRRRGISVSRYFKTLCVDIASTIENMDLSLCPNLEKDDATIPGKSIIHDMFILDLVILKTVNNFNASRPFGL